ncbi:MAG TPA: hypothetical protein VL418_13010 [Devosiaceae bacterium]|nr:hypothetical protein [Devosiaceae bacterium]
MHQPGWQAVEDWYDIATRVSRIEPGIATIVVSANDSSPAVVQQAASLPALIFSPGPLGAFAPARGKIYHGKPIHKFEQLWRLQQAGVSVPRTTQLGPDTRLDPKDWGEFVVVKPTDIASSSQGNGITLMRRERVRYIPRADYPEGHPGRLGPMLVQQFIDTGKHVRFYRVLTLFGRPLYCLLTRSQAERVELSVDDTSLESAPIAIQGFEDRERWFTYEADVMALAAAADRAIPEVAQKGCDIIRDVATGRLYVLEVNPGGNTWHFSSAIVAELRAKLAPDYERNMRTQLDALGTAAHALAERTRLEAE